MTISDLVNWD